MFKSPEKVKATFVDILSREIIETEIELPSFEFQTKEKAYDWVSKKVDDWVYDEGNIKFCTFLEPLLWDVVVEC